MCQPKIIFSIYTYIYHRCKKENIIFENYVILRKNILSLIDESIRLFCIFCRYGSSSSSTSTTACPRPQQALKPLKIAKSQSWKSPIEFK